MTAVAEFRFYEELNDFLPRERRKHAFRYQCARRATVKQAIEAIGVPHTEIELIFVNGESVDFSHLVSDGDRVSVYPQFESLDITPLLRVRERPLRTPRSARCHGAVHPLHGMQRRARGRSQRRRCPSLADRYSRLLRSFPQLSGLQEDLLAGLPPPAHVRTDRRAECRRDLKFDARHSLLS